MRRFLKIILPIFFVLFPSFSSVLGPSTAYAAPPAAAPSEQYTLTFDPNQKGALDSCMKSQNCDRTSQQTILNSTVLFAKDGILGSTPIQFNYDASAPYGNQSADTFAYTGTYSCSNFSVMALIYIGIGSLGSTSYPAEIVLTQINNNTSGQQTGSGNSAVLHYSAYETDAQNSKGPYQGDQGPAGWLPDNCRPKNLGGTSDVNSTNARPLGGNPNLIKVSNYTKLSATQKKSWPGADNPTFPTYTGSTTTPSSSGISCDLGITDNPSIIGGILNAVNPLNWLLCGILKGMNGIVNALDSLINSWLVIGTNGSTSTDYPGSIFAYGNNGEYCGGVQYSSPGANPCHSYYVAWQSFEYLALGLLAIITLLIIIAQSIGADILDAYTIRKMLPRVVAGAIILSISWPLMKFLVILSNDLGYGVGQLLKAPFAGIPQSFNTGGANGLLTTFFGAIGAIALGFFGFLSFVGTAAIAVFVAFLVLVVRQIAVIVLIIFAPIAIIAYALPNTQRISRLWWDSFIKMLLMFPMIVAMITIGHIFSAIAAQNSSFVNQVIAFIAYFGPYFAIPFTFRFAGSIMSATGNAVNGRFNGLRGSLSNFRGNQLKQNTEALKAGNRFEGKKWIPGSITAANKFGEASKGIGTGWNGRFGLGQRGWHARRNVDQAAAAAAQQSEGMKAISGKNDYNRVLAEGMGDERLGHQRLVEHLERGGDDGTWKGTHADAVAQADRAVVAAKVAGKFDKAHGIAAFKNMARDGTAIRDTDDLARLAAIAGQGDGNNTFAFAAEAASVSRQVGRSDLAAASEPIGALAFAHSDTMFQKGLYQPAFGEERKSLDQLQFDAWKSGAGGEVAWTKFGSAKGRTIRNDTNYAADVLTKHYANLDAIDRGETTERAYSDDQVMDAASLLRESEMAIENNVGKYNNRMEADKILKDPNKSAAYKKYMSEVLDSGNVNTTGAPIPVTRRSDLISKRVGDRYAAMSPEQRAQLLTRESSGDEPS